MGLISSRIKFLLDAKKKGASFNSTITLGRQKISIDKKNLLKLKNEYSLDKLIPNTVNTKNRDFNNGLLENILGMKNLSVMDYSDYQGANILHDLNYPIQSDLMEKYDAVIDGGTIEHIFNFPIAIKNCMQMVKIGGDVFIFSMANNHCGHGFYQFSPELFFRIFCHDNGFKTESVVLVQHPYSGAELSERQRCFDVKDPELLGRRNSLVSKFPLGIMVHAKRVSVKQIFASFPFQSDYSKTWENKNKNKIKNNSIVKNLQKHFFTYMPTKVKNNLFGFYQRWKFSLKRDKEAYRKLP